MATLPGHPARRWECWNGLDPTTFAITKGPPPATLLITDVPNSPVTTPSASLSVDGASVAVSTDTRLDAADDDEGEDFVVLLPGQAGLRVSSTLTEFPEHHFSPALSADGEWLVYNTCAPQDPQSSVCHTQPRLYPVSSSSTRALLDPGELEVDAFTRPQISRHGSVIALQGDRGVLVFENLDPLPPPTVIDPSRLLAISPDGDSVIVQQAQSAGGRLAEVHWRSGSPGRVLSASGRIWRGTQSGAGGVGSAAWKTSSHGDPGRAASRAD